MRLRCIMRKSHIGKEGDRTMPRSKNRHTRRAQKKRKKQRKKVRSNAIRRQVASQVAEPEASGCADGSVAMRPRNMPSGTGCAGTARCCAPTDARYAKDGTSPTKTRIRYAFELTRLSYNQLYVQLFSPRRISMRMGGRRPRWGTPPAHDPAHAGSSL